MALPRLPDAREFDRLLDDAERMIDQIRSDAREILRRARVDSIGVVRAQSFEGRVKGTPEFDATSGAAIAAVDNPTSDPVRRAALKMVDRTREAVKLLFIADSVRASFRPPPERDAAEADVGELWCLNCLRYGFHEPVESLGRCGPCAAFWRDAQKRDGVGRDTPPSTVRERRGAGNGSKKRTSPLSRPTPRVVRFETPRVTAGGQSPAQAAAEQEGPTERPQNGANGNGRAVVPLCRVSPPEAPSEPDASSNGSEDVPEVLDLARRLLGTASR